MVHRNLLSTIYYQSQLPNDKLKWETTYQTNVGIDLGFLNNRFSITCDYYNKNIKNLLSSSIQIPAQSGFTTYTENYGSMETNGFELGFSAQIINRSKLSWTLGGSVSAGKTKIKDMATDYIFSGYDGGLVAGGTQRLIIGQEVGTFYGYKTCGISQFDDYKEFEGLSSAEQADLYKSNDPLTTYTPVSSENGLGSSAVRPGEQRYVDVDGDGNITTDDMTIIGHAQPDLVIGFNNKFSYRNFELNINIDGQFGQDICNISNYSLMNFGSKQQLSLVRQAWTADNPSTKYPRLDENTTWLFSDRFIEDASFVRLQNVTLTYNLPAAIIRKFKIQSAKLFVSGSHLLTITDYTGYNPDVSLHGNNAKRLGHDNAVSPVSRTFRLGINLNL